MEESDDEEYKPKKKIPKETIVRMYGMNEKGKTFCLNVIDYKPFFYVKIPDYWEYSEISQFKSSLKRDLGYLKDELIKVKEVNKKKLYGFDKHKEHKFLVLQFNNTIAWTKARALWMIIAILKESSRSMDTGTILYEVNCTLLRLFHIKDISPSGWISFDERDIES